MRPENLDKFIRNRLKGHKPSSEGKDDLWESIAGALDQQPRPWYGRRNLVPAAMLMGFTLLLSVAGNYQPASLTSLHADSSGFRATSDKVNSADGNTTALRNSADFSASAAGTQLPGGQPAVRQADGALASTLSGTGRSGTGYSRLASADASAQNLHSSGSTSRHRMHRHTGGISSTGDTHTGSMETSLAENSRPMPYDLIPAELNEKLNTSPAVLASPGPLNLNGLQTGTQNSYRKPFLPSAGKDEWAGWHDLNAQIWNNPGYTGATGRASLTWHDRLPLLNNKLAGDALDNLAADVPLGKTPVSVGIFHNRNAGPISLLTATGLAASYKFNVAGGNLHLGMSGVRYTKQLFQSLIVFENDFSPDGTLREVATETYVTSTTKAFGVNAGLYFNRKNLVVGVSGTNLNTPHFGLLEDGEKLRREFLVNAGYRIKVNNDLQVMPWAEISRNPLYTHASASLTAVYRNTLMLSTSYQNIDPITRRGDLALYAGVNIKKHLRVFSSFGRSLEVQRAGIRQTVIQSGIRYQF